MLRGKGQAYRIFIDGLSYDLHGDTANHIVWPHLPHPDLSDPDSYPQETYIYAGDLPSERSYNLQHVILWLPDEYKRPLQSLMDESKQWFGQPSGNEIAKQVTSQLATAATKATIATALLRAGIPMRRRTLVKSAAALLGFQVAKETPLLSLAAGEVPDIRQQEALTKAANILGESFGDEDARSWYISRTALIVEKADFESKRSGKDDGRSPAPVDMLYGSLHAIDLERIMENPAHRRMLIKKHMELVLRKFDATLSQNYPTLLPKRELILQTVARSFVSYDCFKVNMPWGKNAIPPDQMGEFNKQLLQSQTATPIEVPALRTIAFEVFKDINVRPWDVVAAAQ